MAVPTVIQSIKFVTNTGAGGTVNNMITFAGGTLAVAGLANFHTGSDVSALAISDSVGGAYSLSGRVGGASHPCTTGMFYRANAASGAVNVTWAVVSGGISLFMHEVDGVVTTTPQITAATAVSTVNATTHDSGEITNTGSDDAIYLAVMSNDSAANPATVGLNASGTEGTWSEYNTDAHELNGVDNMVGSMVNLGVNSVLARGHVWSTALSTQAATVIAVFTGVVGTPQYARPASDQSVGTWTTDTGGTTNLYQAIDETTASDADYIQSIASP